MPSLLLQGKGVAQGAALVCINLCHLYIITLSGFLFWSSNELVEIIKKNSGNKHCSFCEFQ